MKHYSVVHSLVRRCYSKNVQLNFNFIARNHSSRKMEKSDGKYSVLSIQSHVVHGYVGNKSATFPLQVLGFEVDAINSVHFSNHTGYDVIKGQVMNEEQLHEVFEGLKLNSILNHYTHLLTGYIGNESFLRKIADIVKQLREVNPNLIYVCDPVMGDDGVMYVPKTLLPIYRDEIIPLADIATPNQFEVELLTDIKLKTEDDAWNALNWFHNRGVATVVLSSTNLGIENTLLAFLSHQNKVTGRLEKYKLPIPILGGGIQFTGTGDLFAALFLAHSTIISDVGKALETTSSTLHSVIKNTIKYIPNEVLLFQRKVTSRERELKIIQSKQIIENPVIQFNAEKLP